MIRDLFKRLLTLAIAAVILLGAVLTCGAAYADGTPDLGLTEEERAFVANAGPLKVGYVQDRVPVSFQGGDGELTGISRYIFDRLAQISGLEFTYVPLPTGEVTYDYLLGERFALVTSVEYNEENKRANGILISEPYLTSRKVVVARSDLEFDYNAHLKVAISTGSQTIRKVLGNACPNFELVDYESISACFDAVNSGEADLLIQNQYVAEYWMSKPVYEEMKVIPVLGMDDELCFSAVVAFGGGEGVPEEDGRVLIDILDKAIAAMSEDEVGSCTIQGIMDNQYSFTLDDFMYRYRYAAWALGASALVIVVLAFLLTRQRMRAVQEHAEAKAKGEFLSTMSHEIRTPLNGLIGLNYLMAQKVDDPKRLEGYLRQSSTTAKYLLSLVNDILDMSKLQDKKMELVHRPVDLELLISTVDSLMRGGMTEKKLDFQVETTLDFPCVLGDEVRIQQVIVNLLDNARKFTPEGGHVTLRVEQSMLSSGAVLTRAEVADTGRGMSEEFQKRVFYSFAQELDTVSKGNRGTGLGLPISQSLARLMGGDVTFTSKKGEGSTFVFTFTGLPAEKAREEEQTSFPEKEKPRVLVAEDNELNGEIMMELLTGAGFEAVLAHNGREALDIFQRFAPGTFSVILMDLLMPELDGFQAAAAIRAMDREDAKTVKIFACTANSFAEDRKKALASGMDDFIPKPVDVEELLKKIAAS